MTFDEWWEAYCARTGNLFAENRGLAEEVWNAAQEAVLMPLLGARDEGEADGVDTN